MPPRAQPPRDTRDRIVEAARGLFWEKGYAATGLAELLDKAGANSGSFYHFFESKDALLRVVLDTYVELLEPQVLRAAWSATGDPIERVFALLDAYRARLVETGCSYGCPIGRLASRSTPRTHRCTRASRRTSRHGERRSRAVCAPAASRRRRTRRRSCSR